MTNEELIEYVKCKGDVTYFIETHVKARHPMRGIISVKLNDFQKDAIKDFSEKTFFSKTAPRQVGKTFLASALFLHECLFNDHKVNVVFANRVDAGNRVLEVIAEMYSTLPEFLKHTKIKLSKTELEFSNGSVVKSFGNNVSKGRGMTISNVYFEESEFIRNLQEIVSAYYHFAQMNSRMFAFTSSATSEAFKELTTS